jgi:hypothetical protein
MNNFKDIQFDGSDNGFLGFSERLRDRLSKMGQQVSDSTPESPKKEQEVKAPSLELPNQDEKYSNIRDMISNALSRKAQFDAEQQDIEPSSGTITRAAPSPYALNNIPKDKETIQRYINDAAKRRGLNPDLMASMIEQESGYNPAAVSKTGARGLGQMFPAAFEDIRNSKLNPNADLYKNLSYNDLTKPENWRHQVDSALDYYNLLQNRTKSTDPREVLKTYYGGMGNQYAEQGYEHADKVLSKFNKTKQLLGKS